MNKNLSKEEYELRARNQYYQDTAEKLRIKFHFLCQAGFTREEALQILITIFE